MGEAWAAVVMADDIDGMAWGEHTSRDAAIHGAVETYRIDYDGEHGELTVRVYRAPVWIVRDDGIDEIVSFASCEDVKVYVDADGLREVKP